MYDRDNGGKLGGNRYEYISGSFYENGNFQERNLIDRIIELFGADERQLIILKAAAGYGKTCTSFEMIRPPVPDRSAAVSAVLK